MTEPSIDYHTDRIECDRCPACYGSIMGTMTAIKRLRREAAQDGWFLEDGKMLCPECRPRPSAGMGRFAMYSDTLRKVAATMDGGGMGDLTAAYDPVQAVSTLRYLADAFERDDSWISVEERLPVVAKRVLATDGVIVSVGQWSGEWRVWAGFEAVRNITYWMPLPEPPE